MFNIHNNDMYSLNLTFVKTVKSQGSILHRTPSKMKTNEYFFDSDK